MSGYPRDMCGYGRNPPEANWPGGARTAVQFVINYEEGGENCVLHGDSASEAFLSEIVGAQPIEGARHMNMESIYEYGSRAGFWRLHRLFTHNSVPVTVFAVAMALERNPDAVQAMQEAGWEIASHGYRWIDYQHVDESTERAHLAKALEIHERATGSRPAGWYLGRCSPNSHRLAAEEGSFAYNADCYSDDLPYWDYSFEEPQLMVPYTLDANDMRFATPQGFNSGQQFYRYLKDSFKVLHEEGGRMMSIGLHCRLAGRPGRAAAVAKFLAYLGKQDDVWVATRLDIAQHWREQHPPQGAGRTIMDSHDFIARYAGIYEHSPWVAERVAVFAADITDGDRLARLMADCVDNADTEQQLKLIRAHPDLAGKAQVAGDLTAESTEEQMSAGLDHCSKLEYEKFQGLNVAYKEKFEFPFVMAVRQSNRAEILEAFSTRLENDYDVEFETALAEIHKIARLRLAAMETER